MNTVQRFFRRYIFSMVGIMVLFFAVNVALLSAIMIAGSMSGSDSSFSIGEFSDHVILQDGNWGADDAAISMLREESAWAMLLNEDGDVVWQQDLPENLPRSYTSAEVASFSRWYLEDYPVKIWTRADGCLMVVGFQPRTLVKYYFSLEWPYMGVMFAGIGAVFIGNLVFIVFLVLRNTRRVERAMTPILEGIQNLSHGRAQYLKEQGELAEINAGLNRAADYMRKKDNTRAEWIRGVSHDIRTPLSMIMGYAGRIAANEATTDKVREQAEIVRKQSVKIKELVQDLNLVSQLEYEMQPLHKEQIRLSKLIRSYVAELLNSGISDAYTIEIDIATETENAILECDARLISRAINNLVQNSIKHNPQGCKILLSLKYTEETLTLTVADNGVGLTPEKLQELAEKPHYMESTDERLDLRHGLGLLLVRQIVEAHDGSMKIDSVPMQGYKVTLSFSTLLKSGKNNVSFHSK